MVNSVVMEVQLSQTVQLWHEPLTRIAARSDLSPQERGEVSATVLLVPASHETKCMPRLPPCSLAPLLRGEGWGEGQPRARISLLRLAGILHRLEGREFDVVEFAVDLLDLADIDVLYDVAGFGIDRDRAARAFPLHALHRRDQRIAIGLAASLLQRLVDQPDTVIAADRHEARAGA